MDEEGSLIAKRRIPKTPEGFAEFTAMLAEAGDCGETPIPVAIETPRGLLVAALRAAGRRCMRSIRWRLPGIGSGARSRVRKVIMSMRWRAGQHSAHRCACASDAAG
nr:IS110 family transposase [Sciscionella marina]